VHEQNRSEGFFKGLADAVRDIREKIVEEPWWGRSLSDRESASPQWPQAKEPEPSVGSITREIDKGPTHDQMQGNANYRLAAMERELNRPQWPQAEQARGLDQERGRDVDRDKDRGLDR
jgi:hypothetical protein